jgi:hypothetical protein
MSIHVSNLNVYFCHKNAPPVGENGEKSKSGNV